MNRTSVHNDAEQMDSETVAFAVELFSALAHPTRLRVVESLTFGGLTVGEIAASLGILQPNASQHLAILQRAGIVKCTPNGAQRVYAIRGPRIARILLLVHEFRTIHAGVLAHSSAYEDGDTEKTTFS